MNFVSDQFICFLVATWLLFLIMPATQRWLLLLIASYIFYGTWSIPFIGVILLSTTVDYVASRIIYNNDSQSIKRTALSLAIFANILILGVFKYFNFFVQEQAKLCGIFGWNVPLPHQLNIVLPLGISFYTFEAISYLVDTYRGAKPAPNWLRYNFYIMYFPHLISGPIVRFNELWTQYEHTIERPSIQRILKGVELIVLGYFFKTVIANLCAMIADPVYAAPTGAGTLTIYCAALAFLTQLYMDFLGYTHIARGVSLLFNIELPLNFNHPFHANHVANFWKRWHISLSRWLQDYIYVPLGGNKSTLRNVCITFLIAGLWHGAGWNYIIFGLYFGILIGFYHFYSRWRAALFERSEAIIENTIYKQAAYFVTFWLVLVGFVIFRAPDITTIGVFVHKMINVPSLIHDVVSQLMGHSFLEIGTCLVCLLVLLCGPVIAGLYQQLFKPMPYWLKVQMASATVVLCWVMCSAQVKQFIYFQF